MLPSKNVQSKITDKPFLNMLAKKGINPNVFETLEKTKPNDIKIHANWAFKHIY